MPEASFTTFRGTRLQATTRGSPSPSAHNILALHGWLDNCATWDILLDAMFAKQPTAFFVVALDFAGHGLSDHRGPDADYLIYNYIEDVVSVIESLQWTSFSLLGHSMGGGVATLAASLLAPKITSCITIEALGPVVRKSHSAHEQAKKAIQTRADLNKRASATSNLTRFQSIQEAVHVRMRTGIHPISERGTRLLVERGVRRIESDAGDGAVEMYVWSSDPVAVKSSPVSYTEGGVQSFLSAIQCPVLNIYGDGGMFKWFNLHDRADLIKDFRVVHLKGSHHLHLEEETVEPVADAILDFLADLLKPPKTALLSRL
ncbi:hypothetical protein HDU78_001931 [Chytriomyces hyalinus]|nr:hypothetical protein HDU78_001931 [Chytriomyces hyalinus]